MVDHAPIGIGHLAFDPVVGAHFTLRHAVLDALRAIGLPNVGAIIDAHLAGLHPLLLTFYALRTFDSLSLTNRLAFDALRTLDALSLAGRLTFYALRAFDALGLTSLLALGALRALTLHAARSLPVASFNLGALGSVLLGIPVSGGGSGRR